MTEMVTSGSMSGAGKRSDGLLGESDPERCCSHSAPPALYATALLFDSSTRARFRVVRGCPLTTNHPIKTALIVLSGLLFFSWLGLITQRSQML